MKSKGIILFIVILIFCACGQAKEPFKSFLEISKIYNEIAKKFGEQVSVSILNSKYIVITLTNSIKNDQPKAEQDKYAIEIAFYVYDHLDTINKFEEIRIRFVSRSDFVIIHSQRTITNYEFPINELAKSKEKTIEAGTR